MLYVCQKNSCLRPSRDNVGVENLVGNVINYINGISRTLVVNIFIKPVVVMH